MDAFYGNTESRILEAAKDQFIRNGMDGTSMQNIADEAGINKSLLHYYYRTKENLFEAVFRYALQKFIPRILESMVSEQSIFERIRMIVSQYIDMLQENPFIPMFILHEIHRNPQRPADIILGSGLDINLTLSNLIREEDKPLIKPVDPVHLIVNIISLCVFPYAASPLLNKIIFNNSEAAMSEFIHERKMEVTGFVINAIKK